MKNHNKPIQNHSFRDHGLVNKTCLNAGEHKIVVDFSETLNTLN